MNVGRSLARVNPAAVRHDLRGLGDALLARGGCECITGDIDDPHAPCIRSVIQIDGDIITEVRAGDSSDALAALVRAHRSDVDDWFGGLQRVVRTAQFWIVGVVTMLSAVAMAVVTGSVVPLAGLAGSALLSSLRRFERWSKIAATAALVVVSIVVALWAGPYRTWWLFAFWSVSVVLVLIGLLAGYVAQRYVRRQLVPT